MKTQTLLSRALAISFAAFAATAAVAGPVGDADPGYPGLSLGQQVATMQAGKETPRHAAMRVDMPYAQGEAFHFPELTGMPKTRAQVRAETLEAIRVGAISNHERYMFPSAQQLESIRQAGLNALAPQVATTGAAVSAN